MDENIISGFTVLAVVGNLTLVPVGGLIALGSIIHVIIDRKWKSIFFFPLGVLLLWLAGFLKPFTESLL